jgi:hypothetical protein
MAEAIWELGRLNRTAALVSDMGTVLGAGDHVAVVAGSRGELEHAPLSGHGCDWLVYSS